MKKPTKIGNLVLEYLTRNTKYDDIPKGYHSKDHVIEVTGYSARQFVTFMAKARKNKMVESAWFRVARGARCCKMPYYKFHPELVKLMGLTSR